MQNFSLLFIEQPSNSFEYTVVSHHQNLGQNHSILIAIKWFQNVAKFKYLGTVTNQHCIHGDINSRLNTGNACYHSAGKCTVVFKIFLHTTASVLYSIQRKKKRLKIMKIRITARECKLSCVNKDWWLWYFIHTWTDLF